MTPFVMDSATARLAVLQRTWLRHKPLSEIQILFFKSCLKDLHSMEKVIHPTSRFIMDIGSGIGGIDVLLYRHLKGKARIHLFDRDYVDNEVTYGFSDSPSAYNTSEGTESFMLQNGIPENHFKTMSILPKKGKYDVIMSLISCGFHYSVSVYLDWIKSHLDTAGIVILDVRKDTGQFEILEQNFRKVDIIQNNVKYHRVVCYA